MPTWNYEVMHVHGRVTVHDDTEWTRAVVERLTDRHERTQATPWQVSDAPADFVDGQLRAIVGVEIEITSLVGKRKLSGTRSDEDREGVIDGLAASADPRHRVLRDAMLD